ncbi:MAG TPA: hypothetical protein VMJ92_05100, partial [Candidatus Limnocylindrales bacterium]|nr:hypothetical protein [Candidatus Limnocylindrales bacterium]
MFGLNQQPRALRALLITVITLGFVVLAAVSMTAPAEVDLGRIFFWLLITLVAVALPVRVPGGVIAHLTTGPLLAALFDTDLANPFGLVWIAFLGTFELRDLRREIPWFATLYNKFDYVLS